MRKARQTKKHSGRLALIIALFVLIGAGLFSVHFWEQQQRSREAELRAQEDVYTAPELARVYYNDAWYEMRNDLETYLVIGVDKFTDSLGDPNNYINHQQADFLMLMIVDKTSHSFSALHINRDTMAEIQRLGVGGVKLDTVTAQLALAHTYGSGGRDSCRNTVQAVSRYLYDVPVQHYFALPMDAIPVLNDLAGGVTVHVDDDFSNTDPSIVQGKDVTLRGDQALTFVRARGSMRDNSNLARMNRQRAYIDALYRQLSAKLKREDGFAARLASSMSDYLVSDLTTTELSNLAERIKDYPFTGIETIPGEAVVGERYMEFTADEAQLQELVIRLFFRLVDN